MKKLLFACLLTVIMVSSFSGCKKDTNQQLTSNEKNSEYTPEALAIWHKLVIFNEKMKTGSRGNEVISADSVVWYLESMLNIQHAVDTSFCDSFKHDDT
ncbi:MAG: hypothetical protein Q8P20_07815 [bacterium]|nr:hypothetical protein [bacterium]